MTPHAQWDALLKLHEQASPTPWKTEQDWTHELLDANGMLIGKLVANAGPYDRFIDAKLVIELVNAAPALAAEYRRMRERLEAAERVCRTVDPDICTEENHEAWLAWDALRGAKGEP